MSERRTIEVKALARVEGEGALHLTVEAGEVTDLRLEIFEPPRFFEAFLRGRGAAELPDLIARICGICPVAYQMSAVHALEQILGVQITSRVRALRRLYYAGEWLESHLLHMMFLAAPDFLGLEDAMEVARQHRAEVERALALRALGVRTLSLLGGRAVNPVGVKIGGFHRVPTAGERDALRADLEQALPEAEALLRWFADLPVPRRPQAVELVALRHPDEYPMNEGRIVSSLGLDLAPEEFDARFEESQVPHSTARHYRVRGRGVYLTGPLARVWLNRDRLAPRAAAALAALAERFETPDPAASVFARGIEVIQAFEEAIRVLASIETAEQPQPSWAPGAGAAAWATEAPRGVLHVALELDATATIARIRIVPPTSQNQAQIEADLRALAPSVLALPHADASRLCESAIRDYDPCISCATHFLRLQVEHRERSCPSA
jgi:coenzyme F420-reducing hydrogenase alpha subunit